MVKARRQQEAEAERLANWTRWAEAAVARGTPHDEIIRDLINHGIEAERARAMVAHFIQTMPEAKQLPAPSMQKHPESDAQEKASSHQLVVGPLSVGVLAGQAEGASVNWSLDAAKAESILREIAEKHRAHGALKRLGKFKPKLISNAQASFAQKMTDEEVPLAMVDASFFQPFQIGKAGLLLTNRRLYGSQHKVCIDLVDIYATAVQEPTELQRLLVNSTAGKSLLVNGTVVHSESGHFAVAINHRFWSDLLLALGRAARDSAAQTGRIISAGDRDWSRIAAASVCSGQSEEVIVANLCQQGMDPTEALQSVREMIQVFREPRRGQAVFVLIGGFFLILLGFLAMKPVYFLWGLFMGVSMIGISVYRLVRGSPPLSADGLLNAWRARCKS